jgi:hypothetical protein
MVPKKVKINHRHSCILLVYIHIARLCTVHTTSNRRCRHNDPSKNRRYLPKIPDGVDLQKPLRETQTSQTYLWIQRLKIVFYWLIFYPLQTQKFGCYTECVRVFITEYVNARCIKASSVNARTCSVWTIRRLASCRTKNSARRIPASDNRRNNRLYSNYQCVGGNIIAGNILFIGMQSCYSRGTEINTENIKANKQSAAIVFRAKL